MSGFQMRRLVPVMSPDPENALEVEGVLNPAAVRGPDGELYLFPRLVGRGNYSRIGVARVRFDGAGDPCGVERLGVALEPEAEYERRPDGGGGCEDPRITFVEPLGKYVMTYTAFSPAGPRIALAVSDDLRSWERLGLARFGSYQGIELDGVDNKDATLFPVFIPNPLGQPELAMLHRPVFAGAHREENPRRRPSDDRGPRSGEHLDLLQPDHPRERRVSPPGAVHLPSPPGGSRVVLGAAQDRCRDSTRADPARLAGRLPRCE